MLAKDEEAAPISSAGRSGWRLRFAWPAAWVLTLFVLCPPRLAIGVGRDPLGSSFVAALEQGLSSGLHWGSQIVWTYGPYGALDFNLGIEPRILLIALTIRLFTHLLFLSLVAAVFWFRKAPPLLWVVSGACFFVVAAAGPLELNTECVLVAAVGACLAFSAELTLASRWRVVLMTTGGIALALASLDKIGNTLDAIGILLVVTVHSLLVRRNFRAAAAGWASWLVGMVLLWMLAGQRLLDAPAYVRTAFELIGGYASAMADGSATWVTVMAALIVASLAGATVILTLGRARELALSTALALVVVLMLFKEGFVRADTIHIDWFLVPSVYLLVTLAATAVTGPQNPDRTRVVLASSSGAAVIALLVATVTYPQPGSSFNFIARVAPYGEVLSSIVSPLHREELRAKDLAEFMALYRVPATLIDRVRRGTLDVLPLYNAASLVYGLRGAQQPVLQSYSAYTSYLDGLDAAFFASSSAPDFILVAYLPIDGRLLQFDEPLALRALINNYQVDPLSSDAYVLLDRRPRPRPPATSRGSECIPLGQPVDVPQLPGERVYAHVRVPISVLGIITGLAYRPGILHIAVSTLDHGVSRTRTFRFVNGTGDDGLLVSGLATDASGLAQLLDGSEQNSITSFRIIGDWPEQYAQRWCVRFESTARS